MSKKYIILLVLFIGISVVFFVNGNISNQNAELKYYSTEQETNIRTR